MTCVTGYQLGRLRRSTFVPTNVELKGNSAQSSHQLHPGVLLAVVFARWNMHLSPNEPLQQLCVSLNFSAVGKLQAAFVFLRVAQSRFSDAKK